MKAKKKLGIRTQVFMGFAIFTVIIVTLLWIFQITLLNAFYGFIKENEVRRTADSVVKALDGSSLKDTLEELAVQTNVDIMVTDQYGIGIGVINGYQRNNDLFQRLTISDLAQIYSETSLNGGEFMQRFGNDTGEIVMNPGAHPKKDNQEYIVFVKTVTTEAGNSRMLLLKTNIIPVDATVDTLKIQLWCLTGVMLALSFVLAMVISSRISRPIVAINESAKILAAGDYSTRFEEKGSREVTELARTLNYAGEELSKVDGLRKELIANVSHDLRTPLTMITGYSEVMRDIPGENTPENVQIIIDESNRLTDLVNGLLDISKLEAGKVSLVKERVNLTKSIEGILTRYDKLADYHFSFYHGDDIFVMGDELKLSQVVYNLVNNAITYTGADKSVTVTQTLSGGKVKIEVTDTGAGIPEDKLKDIWERYYKVDKEHKRAAVGTGLGLSIVRNVIDLHGGEYGVVSAEGSGSTFWFSLDAAE